MTEAAPGWAIGIDVGGTFTDVVVCAPDGTATVAKVATTPSDQSKGVLDGLRRASAQLGLALPNLLERDDISSVIA